MTHSHTLLEDPALPKLSIALDAAAMKPILQAHVIDDGEGPQPTIEHCDIFHTRYKRGRYCLICYQVTLRGPDNSRQGQHIFCARMFGKGGAISRFNKAKARTLVTPQCGKPLTLIPELDMVVWAFPNDRKLRGLPALMNQRYLKEVVASRIVKTNLGENWDIQGLTSELIHYVGEHTCTTRMSISLSHSNTRQDQPLVMFGKTYYNAEGEKAYQAMNTLWNSDTRERGHLLMAQPLWYDKEQQTLWQRGLSGKTLMEHDLAQADAPTFLKQAAAAVALLHQTRVRGLESHCIEEQFGLLNAASELLTDVQPACSVRLTQLMSRLRAQAPFLDSQPPVTLHEDLHLKNFFVTPSGVALIDLDNLRTGSLFHDIGGFLSNLYYHGLATGETLRHSAEQGETFLREYEVHIPWPLSRETLSWFVAVALVTERAYRCATRLKNGRLELIPPLLELANHIIQENNPIYQETMRPAMLCV